MATFTFYLPFVGCHPFDLEVILGILSFSFLFKNWHLEIPIRSGYGVLGKAVGNHFDSIGWNLMIFGAG